MTIGTAILSTQNEDWGFWGTAKQCLKSKKKTEEAWISAFILINEIAGFNAEETREILDSRWGRYLVDEFYDELKQGIFIEAFKNKVTKARLYRDFNYFVDDTKYKNEEQQKYVAFCNELKVLSEKYGIVIKAVGGVTRNAKDFVGYNSDLGSGDLMPIWKE